MTKKLSHSSEKRLAFKQLFDDYYAPFCLWAKRWIENSAEREDIVQDVFVALWERGDVAEWLSRREDAVAYLKTCVRNACLNRLHHHAVEHKYADACRQNATDTDANDDDILTAEALYARLEATLRQLPDSHRLVFAKSFYEGKTHDEIARELNMSAKSVGRYKKRVLIALREHWYG